MLTNQQRLTYLRHINKTLREKWEHHVLSELRYYVFNTILYEDNIMLAGNWGIKAISIFPHMDYLHVYGGERHVTYEDIYSIVKGLR